jgi:RNA polymerase sigma-70 factor (ECF subfamily)
LPPRTESAYESRLVERFRQGDTQALSTLFEMHVDRVYGFARHILGNREDAEEVASEAFIRALRKASDYRGDAPFHAWLFGITRNLCRDQLRQPRLLTLPMAADDAHDFGGDSARARLSADVRHALAELPEDQRDVLVLCDVEEWDAREAAEMLDRSLAATKSLLYRARRALRERLTERWDEADGTRKRE